MTYVSRPVRHLRDDPISGETVALLLRVADDADPGAVAERATELGEVERLAFDALRVTVDHERVSDACELDGLAAVETAGTVDQTAGDAGEDVG